MKTQRTIVITGGGSGIGRATAQAFSENGDKVFILGRDLSRLEAVSKELKGIIPIEVDITNVSQVEKAVRKVEQDSKQVDVLINCAGGNIKIEPDASLTEAHQGWQKIVNLNLTGAFNVVYAVLPLLARPGGRVILVTSLAAFAGSSQSAANGQAYAASKSGVHGLARTLAGPLAKEGITVNCVAPGVVDHTDFFGKDGMAADRKAINIARTPLGRLGEPANIASGIFYLASDEASFITGEVLNINGGVVFGR